MRIEKASSITEGFEKAIAIIDQWSSPDSPYCWFRGVNNNQLNLRPGAVWRTGYNEHDALVSFVQEGVAFADIGSIQSWDTYYLAQHHGMPTRLLDWTESFSSAMFFALDGAQNTKTPCVWILRPEAINEQYLKWGGIIAPENYKEIDPWLPRGILDRSATTVEGYLYDNENPLAIYAKKSNRRIIAQQGAFTLHGRNTRSLDQMISQDFAAPDNVLARIDFEGIDLKKQQSHLEILGVKRSSIYPDIDNLVKQLGNSYWPAPSSSS